MFKALDYTIESPQERCKFINEIIEDNIEEISDHYENYYDLEKLSSKDKMSVQLEKYADYILYSEKRLESGTINKNRWARLKELDTVSFEQEFLESEDEEENTKHEEIIEGYVIGQSKINNNRRFKKNEVTKEDYIKYPELQQFRIAEWNLTKRIQKIEENNAWMQQLHKEGSHWLKMQDGIYWFEKVLRSIRKERNQYKEYIVRSIYFKKVGLYTSEDNFDWVFPYSFTDIIDYENSENLKNQFYYLLRYYSKLKESCDGEMQNDMTYIISCFEDLIDSCDFEPYLFDILVWKIDRLKSEVIQKRLIKKYGLDYSLSWISQLYKHKIIDKLYEKWQDGYEDWLYTYKLKGNWKQCSKCGEVKLATEKYFYKRSDSLDGFRKICKKCLSTAEKN